MCSLCFTFFIEDPQIFEDKDDDDDQNGGNGKDAEQNEDLPVSSSTSLFECRKSLRTKK